VTGLIRNELIKIVKQKKIYIMAGVILAITMALVFVSFSVEEAAPLTSGGQAFPISLLEGMANLLPVLLIFLVADMVAGEYNSGTLKLSLLYPVSRGRLLLSKMITILVMTVILLAFTLVTGYIAGVLAWGWEEGFTYMGLEYGAGKGVMVTLQSYLITVLPVFSLGILFLFLSLLVKTGTATLGLSLVVFLAMSFLSDFMEIVRPLLITSYLHIFQFILLREESAELSRMIVPGFTVLVMGSAMLAAVSLCLFQRKDILQ